MTLDPKTIDTVLMLVQLGIKAASGVPEARKAYDKLQAMKAEGRDPTADDFAELAAVTATLHDQIQNG